MNIVKIVADIYEAGIIQSSIKCHGGGVNKKRAHEAAQEKRGAFLGSWGVWGERTLRSLGRELKTWNF